MDRWTDKRLAQNYSKSKKKKTKDKKKERNKRSSQSYNSSSFSFPYLTQRDLAGVIARLTAELFVISVFAHVGGDDELAIGKNIVILTVLR